MSKKPVSAATLSLGSTVRLRRARSTGEIVEGPDKRGRYLIALGSLRIWSTAEELELLNTKRAPKSRPSLRKSSSTSGGGCSSCDLHGQSKAEALENLESCLNQALLRGDKRIEVIHGIGKGILKEAALNYFRSSPCVVEIKSDLHNPGAFWVYL